MMATRFLLATSFMLSGLAWASALSLETFGLPTDLELTDTPTKKGVRFAIIGTGDSDSSCDYGETSSRYIYLTMDGMNHERCQTKPLDTPKDDYMAGATDVFDGALLGDCGTADFSSGLFQFEGVYSGGENWCAEFVVLVFNDGTTLDCEINQRFTDKISYRCLG